MHLCAVAADMTSMFCGNLPIGCVAMSNPKNSRKRLENAMKTHHQILRSEPVTFTYRPTPPSGPAPEPSAKRERAGRKKGAKAD